MEKRKIEVGGVLLTLPVAKTRQEQAQGLMDIKKLAADEGMVFEYDKNVTNGYWMKNTHVPLDVAFVDAQGEIFQISKLEPHDEKIVKPSKPYRWAIEMPRGWFDKHLKTTTCAMSGID